MGRSGVALPGISAGELGGWGAHSCAPVTRGLEAVEAKAGVARGRPGARGRRVQAAGGGRPKGVRVAGGGCGTWGGDPGGEASARGRDGEAGAGGAGCGRTWGRAGAEPGRRAQPRRTADQRRCRVRPPTSEREPTRRAASLRTGGPAISAPRSGMRAPALLPPALLTCCSWLLAPVSALGPAPSRPATPTSLEERPGARLLPRRGDRTGPGGAGDQGWRSVPEAQGSGLARPRAGIGADPGGSGIGAGPYHGARDQGWSCPGGSGIRAGPVPEARGSRLVRTRGLGDRGWSGPGDAGIGGWSGGSAHPRELAGGHRPAGTLDPRAEREEPKPQPGPVLRPGWEGAFALSAPRSRVCWDRNPVPRSTPFVAERVRGPGAPSGAGDWAAVTCAGFSFQREIGVCRIVKHFPLSTC